MSPDSEHPRPRVLCVEDELTLLADLQEELCSAGYEVRAASSVGAALACLDGYAPDLILCDVMLGEDSAADGYDFHRRLREDRPDLAATPFIFLTALGQRSHLLQAKREGIDDYLVKPVDYDLLLATIGARLAQVGRVRSAAPRWQDQQILRLRDVLAPLPGAVLLCDGNRTLRYANHKAQTLMQESALWRVNTAGRLVWPEATAASMQRLQQHFSELCQGDGAGRRVQALEMRSPGDTVLVSLVRLSADSSPDPEQQLFAMFLCSAHSRPVPDVETLRLLFNLTRSEAKIARLLAQGRRTEDVSSELGISLATVSFHLRNLFQKTGVARQSDLVALVLAAGWTLPELNGGGC